MTKSNLTRWQFVLLVSLFVAHLAIGTTLPFMYMNSGLAFMRTPMLIALIACQIATVPASYLALARIGQPRIFSLSAMLMPLIPIVIYVIASNRQRAQPFHQHRPLRGLGPNRYAVGPVMSVVRPLMCILKAFSQSTSFKSFADSTAMPVYSCFDKGDLCNPKSGTTYDDFRISFDVSDKDWDDFPGQTEDAILFLSKWESELHQFILGYKPSEMILDFPLYSRLNDNIINQNDYLPKELIALAGRLRLCIGMSIYQEDRIVEL